MEKKKTGKKVITQRGKEPWLKMRVGKLWNTHLVRQTKRRTGNGFRIKSEKKQSGDTSNQALVSRKI